MFAGGSLGLILHRVLAEKHVTGSGKDMVAAVVGLVTLLSALVLGLLIWTAYSVYPGQSATIQTLAAKVLQLDRAGAGEPIAASGRGSRTGRVRNVRPAEFQGGEFRGFSTDGPS